MRELNLNNIPKFGVIKCQVPKFPLSPGRYKVGARVVVNGIEADWPLDGIGYIDVELGDYYGTGSKGFEGNSIYLLNGKWQIDTK